MKQTLKKTFWQLILIYSILIVAIALGFMWKFSLQFHIFAIVISILGITLIETHENWENDEKPLNKKVHYALFALAILLIFSLRAIPYLNQSIPLGYDTGIYKYGIEHGLANLDHWIIKGGLEPGFLYLMNSISLIFSTQVILTWLLILFCVILGLGVYLVIKEFSDRDTALIGMLIYAFSIIQYKTFEYLYYKNILGMILILFSIYFLRKYEKTYLKKHLLGFIIAGGLIGAVHRPSFYIFGLSYFFYAFISPYNFENKEYDKTKFLRNLIMGAAMIAIALLFYIGKFWPAATNMFGPVIQGFVQTGESPGTFINFMDYQFNSLFYLPFAFLGLFYFVRKKELNILVLWVLINLAIVYFQFFFFNRMIIFLDLALVIMASFGISVILKNKKKSGAIVLCILLLSGGIFAFKEANNSKPLINEQELETIKHFNQTPENSFAMSTSSIYSPWVLGYSERRTIAPGLFDYNNHSKSEWELFWTSQNITEIKSFMKAYGKPIYIFIGQKQKDNLAQFDECFERFYNESNNTLYAYNC